NGKPERIGPARPPPQPSLRPKDAPGGAPPTSCPDYFRPQTDGSAHARLLKCPVIGKPPHEWRQSIRLDSIDPPAALKVRTDNPRRLHELQMLDNGGTRNRQRPLELPSGARHARNTLENNDPDRMPEQPEQAQDAPELSGVGKGLGHKNEVSRPANTFDNLNL